MTKISDYKYRYFPHKFNNFADARRPEAPQEFEFNCLPSFSSIVFPMLTSLTYCSQIRHAVVMILVDSEVKEYFGC